MERRSYLINHSFRYHMFASIMTMSAMNLNSIIDGILMGNLLGSEAFSAINVVIPIVSCISAIGVLLSQGPAIRMARHLGAMEKDRANQVFTVSVVSMLAVGLILSAAVLFTGLARPIINVLCVAKELAGPALKYASIIMIGSVILICENGLSTLVDVMGNPRVVTMAMLIKMGTNILFDILNVKVFGMDIAGAAYATVFSSFFANVIFVIYIIKKSDVGVCACPEWLSDLKKGIVQSVPGFIGSLSAVILMFICNSFIMRNQGADGMFVMSMGYTLISIGSMISNGVGMTYSAIGGALYGQEDYFGMRALFRLGIIVTIITPVCFNIAGLFSGRLAVLFGAETKELMDISQRSLPMIIVMLFALGIVSSVSLLHSVLGHRTISSINTLLIIVMILIAFIFSERVFTPDKIWVAFPIATVLSLSIFFISTTVISLRSGGQLQLVSLIPKAEFEGTLMDISVECNMDEKSKAIDTLIAFLRDNDASEFENRVVHCLDELMMNIISHAGLKKGAFMDLSVMVRKGKISAFLRNDGKPFDPLKLGEDERKAGLKMVFHFSEQLEYRYSFGQNLILASWKME